ncbi:hypothetical protein DENSPDRAFT_3203 [Dentipellis sp. KUC8613]|nr:hypothetical protein DENSPDRAFT_3203 [Dentipellis sp. KUC8613]
MNGRPDMIRQQGIPHISQNVLGMNQPFLPQQPSSAQPPQGQPPNMNLVQNSNNINPGMGFMQPGQPSNAAPNHHTHLNQMHLQQANHQRHQQALLQQSQSAQGISQQPPTAPTVPHLNGIGQVGFPGNMMPGQPNVPRRVVSQTHPGALSPGGPMNAMHPGPQGMVGMPMNMGPGMAIPRQQQPPMNMRAPLPNQQQPMPGHMSPQNAMNVRTSHSMPNMPQGMPRNTSTQPGMMGNMPPGQPHPSGMPPPFQNHMARQQPPMGSSPRPNGHAPSLSQQGNPQMPQSMDRARISASDPPMYMNFQNPQFNPNMGGNNGNISHPPNRIQGAGPSNPQFAFGGPSSTPPNAHPDAMQNVQGGGPPSVITPAQQLAHMNPGGAPGPGGPGEGYPPQFGGMPPPPQAGPPQGPPGGPPPPPGHQQPHQQQQAPQPPRPQSRQRHPTPHLSPRHSQEQMNGHMVHPARPPSQPQQHTPGRPPSQQSGAGPSRTPRVATATLPPNATLLQGRPLNIGGPPSSQPPQPSPAHGQLSLQGGSPSSAMPPGSMPMGMHPIMPPQPAGTPPDGSIVGRGPLSVGSALPRPVTQAPPIGAGQAIVRILQLSGLLAAESAAAQRLHLSYWDELVKDFFLEAAQMKLMLWKDNQRNEAKVFDVTTPILPRFFLVTSQSGVRTMSLTLDGAQERLFAHNHAVVECVSAIWTYRYSSGYIVTLRGPLRVEVVAIPTPLMSGASSQSASNPNYTLKIQNFDFDSRKYERHVSLDAVSGQRISDPPKTPRVTNASTPTLNGTPGGKRVVDEDKFDEQPRMVYDRASLPAEPVNSFGIPQATMRCLELAESVVGMSDLIQFSNQHSVGPIDALRDFAQQIRESHGLNPANGLLPGVGLPPGQFNLEALNGAQANTNSLTLYPPTPAPSALGGPQPPQQQQTPSSIQQGMPGPASNAPSPDKPKGTPKPAHAPNPAGSSGAPTNATSTPSMATASLKRKAQSSETASPTTANSEQPPPKRPARKRGRTNAGG